MKTMISFFLLAFLCSSAIAATDFTKAPAMCTEANGTRRILSIDVSDILAKKLTPEKEHKEIVERFRAELLKIETAKPMPVEGKEQARKNTAPEKIADTERVYEMWELPGKWKCAGKDCSRAEVIEIPEAR